MLEVSEVFQELSNNLNISHIFSDYFDELMSVYQIIARSSASTIKTTVLEQEKTLVIELEFDTVAQCMELCTIINVLPIKVKYDIEFNTVATQNNNDNCCCTIRIYNTNNYVHM